MFDRTHRIASFSLLGCTLLLTSCKQDVILKNAGAFSQYSAKASSIPIDLAQRWVNSCKRMAKLVNENTFGPAALTIPANYDMDCAQQIKAAGTPLSVRAVGLYVNALADASKGLKVNLGLKDTMSNLALKFVGKPEAALIDSLANGIGNLAATSARAHYVKHTVLDNNAALQQLTLLEISDLASDDCRVGHSYCGFFQEEMAEIQTTYCEAAIDIYGKSIGACGDPAHTPPLFIMSLAVDIDTPLSPCSIDAIRARLRSTGALGPAPAPWVAPADPGHYQFVKSAGERQARIDLSADYNAAIATVRLDVQGGFDDATALCEIAQAHQALYDYILRTPDPDDAIFDR